MDKTSASPTQERVLHAACKLFSARGFHATTTQEICTLAQANIAAVNYHYGNKENLYRAVWEHGEKVFRRDWDTNVSADAGPEEQLRQFIAFNVAGTLAEDERGWFPQLVHQEMTNPSPLVDELRERFLHPKLQWFQQLVRTLVGEGVPERKARLAGFCIHSPIVHLKEMRARPRPHMQPPDGGPTADPSALVDTIYTFALAGLRELRRQHEENR